MSKSMTILARWESENQELLKMFEGGRNVRHDRLSPALQRAARRLVANGHLQRRYKPTPAFRGGRKVFYSLN